MTYSPQSPVSDSARPHTGALITAKEISDLINSATAFNSQATTAPRRGVSVLLADVGFTGANIPLTNNGTITFIVTSPGGVTIDVTASIDGDPQPQAEDVVADISSAFNTAGLGEEVDVSSLIDPIGKTRLVFVMTKGYTLTIDSATEGLEAILLGVAHRNPSGFLPYTVPIRDPLHGTPFLNSGTSESSLYADSPARIVGLPLTGQVTGNLRIRLKVADNTATADIALSNMVATQIVAAINGNGTISTFFNNLVGGLYSSYPFATLLNDNTVVLTLDGSYNESEGTYYGAATEIGISAVDVGGQRLLGDVADLVFGLQPRRGTPEYVATNSRKVSFLRGVPVVSNFSKYTGSRGGIGFGYLGAPLGSKADIGSSTEDFEIRYDAHSAIPWAYDSNTQTWSRAIPAMGGALSYDKDKEAYTLLTSNDTFTPDYRGSGNSALKTGSSSWAVASTVRDGGVVGQLPRLVDIRNSMSIMSLANNSTDGRSTFREMPLFSDCLQRTLGKATHQGVPFLGDVSIMSLVGGGVGATARAAIVVGAVGTVSQTYTTYSGASLNIPVQGTSGIPSNSLVRIATSYGSAAADREAAQPVWSQQLAQFVTPTGTATDAATLYSATALPTGWVSSGLTRVAGDDYLLNISYNGSSQPSGEQPTIVSIVPDTSGYPDVSATFRTTDTPTDLLTRAGVIVSSDYTDLAGSPNDWALTNTEVLSLIVTIDTGGKGKMFIFAGGSETPAYTTFVVDSPLNEVAKTLRVAVSNVGGNALVSIYWGGTEDYANSVADERGASGLETFGRGGVEGNQRTPILVHQYTLTALDGRDIAFGSRVADTAILGALPGIFVDPMGTDAIVVDNFATIGFSSLQTESAIPGLPPVSGALLRDSLSAVTVMLNGVQQGVGDGNHAFLISDCTHEDPLTLNLTGDLGLTNLTTPNGVVPGGSGYNRDPGRKINIGFELNELQSIKEFRFWPSVGNFGYGDVSPISPGDIGFSSASSVIGGSYTSNSRSSRTTWDLGDYVLTTGIGYNGFSWVPTGANGAEVAQKYTVLAAGNHTNAATAGTTKKSNNTYRLGAASDIATIESITSFSATSGNATDNYANIKSFNRLTVPPDGYWAPFGVNTATVTDNGFRNGIGSTAITNSRDVPLSLRMDDALSFSAGNISGSGGKSYPTLDSSAGGGTDTIVATNGWWASVPVVNSKSIHSGTGVSDDLMVTRNRQGAMSINFDGDFIFGTSFLEDSADNQRIYCTPAWTPSRTRLVYAFLTTMPSIEYHQGNQGWNSEGTTLRYEVDTAEVDFITSTWLGNTANIDGHATPDYLPLTSIAGNATRTWTPTGIIATDKEYKTIITGAGGNSGGLGHHIAVETLQDKTAPTATPSAVTRRLPPQGGGNVMTKNTGYYDLFSSVYPFTNSTTAVGVDSENTTWFQGKSIDAPHISEVTFAQPGEAGSLTKDGHPFVTVLVAIEYHGPVVPSGIRLRTSAVAVPT
jgi:hypothetical protein